MSAAYGFSRKLLSIELAGYRADETYALDHVLAAYEQGENLTADLGAYRRSPTGATPRDAAWARQGGWQGGRQAPRPGSAGLQRGVDGGRRRTYPCPRGGRTGHSAAAAGREGIDLDQSAGRRVMVSRCMSARAEHQTSCLQGWCRGLLPSRPSST